MSVQLPDGTFAAPVSFSITRQDPSTLPPALGTLPNGATGVIDPVEAYQFTFGVPTLDQDASLVFEILVDGLDETTRDLLLAAIGSGAATLATLGDEPGSTYQAFAICAAKEEPTADGCVRLELLDVNGQPTIETPVIVRFTGVVGHFSTWAVALVSAPTAAPASISGRVTDAFGRGIRGVAVTAIRSDGTHAAVVTNTFGRYRLSGLPVGETYVLSARSRRYEFANPTRIISLEDSITDENFEVVIPSRLPTASQGSKRVIPF
jgi:hypothetical protein